MRTKFLFFLCALLIGLTSAIGYFFITSIKYSPLETKKIAEVLIYLQWIIGGLTLSKLGLDNYIIAKQIDINSTFNFGYKYYLTVTMIAVVVSGIYNNLFGNLTVFIVMTGTILAETYNTLSISKLSASQKFKEVNYCTLLGHPAITFSSMMAWIAGEHILSKTDSYLYVFQGFYFLFAILKLVLILIYKRKFALGMKLQVEIVSFKQMGQIASIFFLNFLMFRVDQLISPFSAFVNATYYRYYLHVIKLTDAVGSFSATLISFYRKLSLSKFRLIYNIIILSILYILLVALYYVYSHFGGYGSSYSVLLLTSAAGLLTPIAGYKASNLLARDNYKILYASLFAAILASAVTARLINISLALPLGLTLFCLISFAGDANEYKT